MCVTIPSAACTYTQQLVVFSIHECIFTALYTPPIGAENMYFAPCRIAQTLNQHGFGGHAKELSCVRTTLVAKL